MRGHIATKNGRHYPVISFKDPGTGKWRRKWLPGHKTKREAEKARAEAVAQVNSGMLPATTRKTVAGLFRDYFRTAGANRVRPVTLENSQGQIEVHLISRFGAKQAAALTADDLNLMMADMVKSGRSATTARTVLRIVHRVLDDAVGKRKLAWNVADFADPPRAIGYEPEVWNEAELDGFLTAAASPEYSDYYELFATNALTGERRGETLGHRWSDVDLDSTSPTIQVRRTAYKLQSGEWQFPEPKTKRSRRTIALPHSLTLLLKRLRERQEANAEWNGREFSPDDFVFARVDGTLPDPRYVSKVFKRIVRSAGLKPIRLHDLRHTYATLQRQAGQPIEVVSKVLGHASVSVTNTIYNHWEGDFRAAADTMDKMLERAAQNQNAEPFGAYILDRVTHLW